MKTSTRYLTTRNALKHWQQQLKNNLLTADDDLSHSFCFHFETDPPLQTQLSNFATVVAKQLEDLVIENNLAENLPILKSYDNIGYPQNEVKHHPSYIAAGNLIYATGLMKHFAIRGCLTKGLAFLLLSSHAGEAGHNCPIACSAGIIRILRKFPELPLRDFYLHQFTRLSFSENFTGAQFLTEIQGGSDVGANACTAMQNEKGLWFIQGEKWFCSNANADVILMTARFDEKIEGTKGLGLFLVPAKLEDGQPNQFTLRRLKQKTGTRSMATAEIDFNQAFAFPVGNVKEGIHLVLENVLHLSRIFNAFSVLGMTRRAYQIAYYYAENRIAFGKSILCYPLVQEQLAKIKAIYTAQLAASFAIATMQDTFDVLDDSEDKHAQHSHQKLLLRTVVNLNKYFTAKYSVENIRHCIDILAGNGTIETFSTLPRLLNDCIVCENWEGTHFTLWMQLLKDIEKFAVDTIFIDHIRNTLATIHHQAAEVLNKRLSMLIKDFQLLRDMDNELKTLKMQEIVVQMAALYSAVCLLQEALHQENHAKNTSKLQCLDLFNKLFFESNAIHKDDGYLTLIKKICM